MAVLSAGKALYFIGCYDNCLGTLLLCMIGNCNINLLTAMRRHFAIIMGTSAADDAQLQHIHHITVYS